MKAAGINRKEYHKNRGGGDGWRKNEGVVLSKIIVIHFFCHSSWVKVEPEGLDPTKNQIEY
jgi:hypothetical protein